MKKADNCNENRTMMQYFEWYLPADSLLWERCSAQAASLKAAGINMLWLPPAYKAASGSSSVGYDVYDTYDLGEFDQKGCIETKYGTREQYINAVHNLQQNGIKVLADIVLNHKMGADECETIEVVEEQPDNREHDISKPFGIKAWTRFNFPGRGGKYSDYIWTASDFSGTDWDEDARRSGIFRIAGKEWNKETDSENVNYDYLMGADLDTDNEQTVKAVTDWGKWYYDTIHMDGVRLDAVKHISFDFYRKWLYDIRSHAGRDIFAVGEYWSRELERMLHYLDVTDNSMSLFDVPLHFELLKAATSDGTYDLSKLFDNSLVKSRPDNAVTFVDNHDTQPGQSLESFIPAWFKPIAYALILLRRDGIPCVFYGDYYGIPHDGIAPAEGLRKLIRLRQLYAYGEENDYFDDPDTIGFTRSGDCQHDNSGMAVIITDKSASSKRMLIGSKFAGYAFHDALGHFNEPVIIDSDGFGEFMVRSGSVSVWVTEPAYRFIRTHVE